MRIRAILLLSTIVVVTAGCGNGEPAVPMAEQTAGAEAPAAEAGPDLADKDFTDETGNDAVAVEVRDNVFVAPYIEVSPGTKITFTNDGEQPHNVKPAVDGAFPAIDTADMQPDDSASLTFAEPGDYAYYCSLHGTDTKGMTGAIRVLE